MGGREEGRGIGMMDRRFSPDKNDTRSTLLLLLGLTLISVLWIAAVFVFVYYLHLWSGDSWGLIWLFSEI
jgi:hypothetical protein